VLRRDRQFAARGPVGQHAEVLATVEELLERVGVDADGTVAEELPHNRWLSPGVWRVRTGAGRLAVLKYSRSDRSPGATPMEAHWTARDHDPRRWTYWCRKALAYKHDLASAYAGSGITAPACLGAYVDDSEAVLLLESAVLHAHRERLYEISESLPRTLCHLDFWPKNLFSQPRGQVILIDWGFAGVGAIGEDAGNLVPDAVIDHFITADQMPRLEEIVFDGYLRGLRAAGWDDDPRLVRLGMWSSAVKYDWLAAMTLAQVREDRQYRYGGAGEIDPVFKFRECGRALLFNARWARQAIDLATQLGL
jgi:hypothetical protein